MWARFYNRVYFTYLRLVVQFIVIAQAIHFSQGLYWIEFARNVLVHTQYSPTSTISVYFYVFLLQREREHNCKTASILSINLEYVFNRWKPTQSNPPASAIASSQEGATFVLQVMLDGGHWKISRTLNDAWCGKLDWWCMR